jgi:hypothetical protein
MKAKAAFVIGATLGYLFGTDKGRVKLEQAKGWANQTWHDPRVQEKVSEVSSSASQFAKERASALKERKSSDTSSTTGPDVDKPPMGL